MTAKGKILVTIVFGHDIDLIEEPPTYLEEDSQGPRILIVDAVVESVEGREMSIVDLRVVLPSLSARAMLSGMIEGETEIAITGMSPVVDSRNSR
jgi:hypothetical protein